MTDWQIIVCKDCKHDKFTARTKEGQHEIRCASCQKPVYSFVPQPAPAPANIQGKPII